MKQILGSPISFQRWMSQAEINQVQNDADCRWFGRQWSHHSKRTRIYEVFDTFFLLYNNKPICRPPKIIEQWFNLFFWWCLSASHWQQPLFLASNRVGHIQNKLKDIYFLRIIHIIVILIYSLEIELYLKYQSNRNRVS